MVPALFRVGRRFVHLRRCCLNLKIQQTKLKSVSPPHPLPVSGSVNEGTLNAHIEAHDMSGLSDDIITPDLPENPNYEIDEQTSA